MFVLKTLVFCSAWLLIQGQGSNVPATTPVPILKQINRQNDDGSYSYGYEAADGSFKIETKYPNGDVAGKYGYIDESGKQREISYGASSARGFEPQGAGIMVPPPTLHEPSSNALTDGQEDDGQYREDPKIYEDPKYNGRQSAKPAQGFRQFQQPAQPAQPEPQYQRQQYQSFQSSFPAQPQYQPQPQYQQPQSQYQQAQYQPQPQSQSQYRSPLFSQQSNLFNQAPQQFPQSQVYHQQPQFSYQAFTPQPSSQFQSQNYQAQSNPFNGHPAQNFDPSTGSYSINFTG
ncbi:cuticular protein RR-1 motif 55 precursor [Bombyx mori]|uniref:Putative cuticle protein n=1 Tax=Bombyx mori TaxID=7091 RepID=C0H6P7_BOMMO|nr:cuticular protein RR-1 motif 55 precursor [Bombyx mori]FAA00558.1 TPA: putative cuticle protein [Bombyx mori]